MSIARPKKRTPLRSRRKFLKNTAVGVASNALLLNRAGMAAGRSEAAKGTEAPAVSARASEASERWRALEDSTSSATLELLKGEADRLEKLRAQLPTTWLRRRITELGRVENVYRVVPQAGQFFYRRRAAADDRPKLCVRDPAGNERVILDVNDWEKGVVLGSWEISPDGKKIVLSERPNNTDETNLRVLDVESGKLLGDVIKGQPFAAPAWTGDGKAFYYNYSPPLGGGVTRQNRFSLMEIRKHRLGTDPQSDDVVRGPARRRGVAPWAWVSKSGQHVLVLESDRSQRQPRTEVYWRRASSEREFVPLPLAQGVSRPIGARGDTIYFHTSQGASMNRIVGIDVSNPGNPVAREVIAEDKSSLLELAVMAGEKLILSYVTSTGTVLRTCDLRNSRSATLPLPSGVAVVDLTAADDEVLVQHMSLSSPETILRFKLSTEKVETFYVTARAASVPVITETLSCPSSAGAPVSMFLLRREDWDGRPAPLIAMGYGGFRHVSRPIGSPPATAWVEAGGMYVVISLPGDLNNGERGYEAGRLLNKKNTVYAFAEAITLLVNKGYTIGEKAGISGSSNGGAIVLAVANLLAMAGRHEPERKLIKSVAAVVARVPVADLECFGSLDQALAPYWMVDYGDPAKPEHRENQRRISPLANVREAFKSARPGRFPRILVVGGSKDDRVNPAHARKYIAEARDAGVDAYLYMHQGAHSGAGTIGAAIESSTVEFAFLAQALGLKFPA